MQEHQLAILIEKYANGQATAEEIKQLTDWYAQKAYQDAVFPESEAVVGARMLNRLQRAVKPQNKKRNYAWFAAAVLLLTLSAGTYFVFQPQNVPRQSSNLNSAPAILPGSNKATLTLAGGKSIVLNGAKNGRLANQAGSTVNKTADGKLTYLPDVSGAGELVYNTLSTPKGGQYNVTLPDGTRVWLNAATSLTYPTAFTGANRTVKLTGEAYFEVAKNPQKPFKIEVAGRQQVVVLGTHFNIEAYVDDSFINTTLMEGSVKLLAADKQMLMKPGEMVTNNLSGNLTKQAADQEAVLAWKNGLFVFNDESIKTAMQKAARWYDVEIEYLDGVQQKRLGGTISRFETISQLLDMIAKATNIKYEIKGRRVILMK